MADLDLRSKRASSVQIMAPYVLAPPAPDGTIDAGDRQHIAWSYASLATVAGAGEVLKPDDMLSYIKLDGAFVQAVPGVFRGAR